MGLTQSNFPAFKLSVPGYPWHGKAFETSDYEIWDAEVKLEDMGEENVYTWQDIQKYANSNTNYMVSLEYDWKAIRKFLENNIFTFTRPGITTQWLPLSWDLNFDLDEDKYFQRPNAFAIKRLLLDKGNEKVKQQVLQNILQLLKAPETKALWEEQKAEFLEWNEYALESGEEAEIKAYQSTQAASYEKSLNRALDYYLDALGQVVHTDNVILSFHHNWILTRIIDGVCRFLKDQSAFKFYSLCYRLDADGCKELKSYLDQAKTELSKMEPLQIKPFSPGGRADQPTHQVGKPSPSPQSVRQFAACFPQPQERWYSVRGFFCFFLP